VVFVVLVELDDVVDSTAITLTWKLLVTDRVPGDSSNI
jgi:hypothetical protein